MKTKYSKPSADISLEMGRYLEADGEKLAKQRSLSRHLADASDRSACLLCGALATDGRYFQHRNIRFFECGTCGQVQSATQVPDGYPHEMDSDASFDAIYPELSSEEYAGRRERIYRPKLDWALESLEVMGIKKQDVVRKRWLEIGAGAGYFLDALRNEGGEDFVGLEINESLCATAQRVLGTDRVFRHTGFLGEALRTYRADIIVAFFVLEHLGDGDDFWDALSDLPAGTVLVFAVPAFGLSTILEMAFPGYAARNLDEVVHTQVFTDKSIAFALKRAGFEMVAEWIFGQDGNDFMRALLVHIRDNVAPETLDQIAQDLAGLVDPIQSAVDHARLADARHVVAIKR